MARKPHQRITRRFPLRRMRALPFGTRLRSGAPDGASSLRHVGNRKNVMRKTSEEAALGRALGLVGALVVAGLALSCGSPEAERVQIFEAALAAFEDYPLFKPAILHPRLHPPQGWETIAFPENQDSVESEVLKTAAEKMGYPLCIYTPRWCIPGQAQTVLHLTHPSIKGDSARILFMDLQGQDGYIAQGGVIHLWRDDGRWRGRVELGWAE